MGKYIDEAIRLRNNSGLFTTITIGEVIDTNDPQQMGRLRVLCPVMGDSPGDIVADIPWATYVSPLGGTTTSPTRGREDDVTAGQIAYGMFNIPKVGSNVLIACIDGDPRFRIWLGCVHDQFLTHTMPHGRYSYKTANKPEGPFSSTEDKIQPLYDSQTEAFTNTEAGVDPRKSHEFMSRGADVGVAGLGDEFVNIQASNISQLSDDVAVEYGDNPSGGKYTNTQGYQKSRVQTGESDLTGGTIYDPQTYSWTTPGFHSMSMTDSADNCRIRFRTTHGHQIIFDDTNERIYISTAGGKTWIEMDEVGNIDIFGERNISVHAGKDINFNAGGTFRVQAADGIHMSTEGEMRLHAKAEMHIKTDTKMFLHSGGDTSKFVGGTMFIETTNDIDMKVGGNSILEAGGNSILEAGGDSILEAGGCISNSATGAFIAEAGADASMNGARVLLTGLPVHLNGPLAPPGIPMPPFSGIVLNTSTLDSFTVSRSPDHEPWARMMIDDAGAPEFSTYDHPDVGREENGEDLGRNPKWHR